MGQVLDDLLGVLRLSSSRLPSVGQQGEVGGQGDQAAPAHWQLCQFTQSTPTGALPTCAEPRSVGVSTSGALKITHVQRMD